MFGGADVHRNLFKVKFGEESVNCLLKSQLCPYIHINSDKHEILYSKLC